MDVFALGSPEARLAPARVREIEGLGPGASPAGGQVLFSGQPAELWRTDTASGRFFSLRERVVLSGERAAGGRPPSGPEAFLWLRRACAHNLREIDVPLPLARLSVITGVSGSGKSPLVEDVLMASLLSGGPVGCRALAVAGRARDVAGGARDVAGKPARLRAVLVDQSPIGVNPQAFRLALLLQPARGRLPDLRRHGRAGGADALSALDLGAHPLPDLRGRTVAAGVQGGYPRRLQHAGAERNAAGAAGHVLEALAATWAGGKVASGADASGANAGAELARGSLRTARARLRFLGAVGLAYLQLSRPAGRASRRAGCLTCCRAARRKSSRPWGSKWPA
jgi:hypothetical protein